MSSGFKKDIDNAPIYGMNTVDHPAILKDGECELLVNAYPGNPPTIRRGCYFKKTAFYGLLLPLMPAKYLNNDDGDYFFSIAYAVEDGYNIQIIELNERNEQLCIFNFLSSEVKPFFSMLNAHGYTYVIMDKAALSAFRTWDAANLNLGLGNKVIEEDGLTVRDMCISLGAYVNQTKDETHEVGGLTSGKFYGYAFTYVRRVDAAAFATESVIAGIILPAGMTGKVPRVAITYKPGVVEGIENVGSREVVEVEGNSNAVRLYRDSCSDHTAAIKQGATHIRIFRTNGQATSEDAVGATKYWLVDIPIAGNASGGYTPAMSGGEFIDIQSDASLALETNTLFMDKYAVAPYAKFALYHNGRMHLFGITGYNGFSMFSETVGGDGCTDLSLAVQHPQKWASMFKPTEYIVDCEHGDSLKDSGIAAIDKDIIYFKESKIYSLFGGDPNLTTVECISGEVGCAFPYTITNCEIKGVFGKCILFLSKKGPYVIQEGGSVTPFTQFKIKELWPEHSKELFDLLENQYEYAIRNCFAAFHNNVWWIFYRNYTGTSKIFGYYFDPALATSSDAPQGPFQFEFASGVNDAYPVCFANKNDREATTLCITGDETFLVCDFLGNTNDDDTNTVKYEDEIEVEAT
jgi:hypothetical protein